MTKAETMKMDTVTYMVCPRCLLYWPLGDFTNDGMCSKCVAHEKKWAGFQEPKTMPTQEQKLIAYIAQRLQMEPDTVEYLLDLAEREAADSVHPEREQIWAKIHRGRRLYELVLDAIRRSP